MKLDHANFTLNVYFEYTHKVQLIVNALMKDSYERQLSTGSS